MYLYTLLLLVLGKRLKSDSKQLLVAFMCHAIIHYKLNFTRNGQKQRLSSQCAYSLANMSSTEARRWSPTVYSQRT